MSNTVTRGRGEEDRAAEHLLALGYTLITRRYKVRHGEIDLICLDGDTLVFVEVKSRQAPGYAPEDSIGADKARALQRTAEEYMRSMEDERPFRFDLICIDQSGLRHHKNFLAD